MGRGNTNIKHENEREMKLCDVQHVPNLRKNLLSIKMMDKVGYSTTFSDNRCKIIEGSLI